MINIFVAPAIFAAMIWWFFGGDFWFWLWIGVFSLAAVAVLYIVFKIAERRADDRAAAVAREKELRDAVARAEWQKKELERWYSVATSHRSALVLRYRQLVTKDAYGGEELDVWNKELVRFRKSVGIDGDEGSIAGFELQLTRMVRSWVREDQESGSSGFESEDPIEYELWCADVLRQRGWKTSITKASADQGVDVVASKDRRKVAIQCKLYSKPVGNKAVQEIHAAAAYVDARHAVVVTNVDYTPAARRLASKLGVLLLHDSQLPKLDALLGEKSKPASGIILPSGGSGFIIRPSANGKDPARTS